MLWNHFSGIKNLNTPPIKMNEPARARFKQNSEKEIGKSTKEGKTLSINEIKVILH